MTRSPRSRRAFGALVLATAGIAVIALLATGHAIVSIGTGFFAKQLCSGVFVSQRAAREVADADLRAYRPAIVMRHIAWRIDAPRGEATASFFGLAARTARFRVGSGCALQPTPGPAAAAATATATEPDPRRSVDAPWPEGDRVEILPNAQLERALDAAFAAGRGTRAVVVVHDGALVAERYASGFTALTPLPGWSLAKSVMNALTGMLVRDGRLRLDEPLALRAWSAADDPRRAVSVGHALTMTTGIAFDENYANPLSDVTRMLFAGVDVAAFAASRPLRSAPGSVWAYTSGTTNLLSAALRERLGDGAYRALPGALFTRLGMASAVFETDAAGTFVGSSFLYATARDWARFGWLYADDGRWQGERVLPEGWVAFTRAAAAGSDERYGAHFWRGAGDARVGLGAPAPDDAMHAAGHAGQFITIVPSARLVVVRLGLSLGERWDQATFVAAVAAAVK